MIDVSSMHPFTACTAFAVDFLSRIAAYDLQGAESMIDVNGPGGDFASNFPAPDGFTYCPPQSIQNWSFHITAADEGGLCCDFDVPFLEKDFRAMEARFEMTRCGNQLQVRFIGVVPS
jgi:hypothetical protein